MIAGVLVVLMVLAIRFDSLARIENSVYDLAMKSYQRPASPEIIIVAIDEPSILQLGRWPWDRRLHATLLTKLAEGKPKAIALDVIFNEAYTASPDPDKLLAGAIRASGNVILPVIPRVGEGRLVNEALPIPLLAESAAGFGHISTQMDADGLVRRANLRAGWGVPKYGLLGVEMLALADPARWQKGSLAFGTRASDSVRTPTDAWTTDQAYNIPYAGPPQHFKFVSYIDVLRGDVNPQIFRDKLVFVGMTAAGLGDEFPTPVSGENRAMAGVEIHANVMQGMMEGINIRHVSVAWYGFFSIVVVIGALLAYLWLSPRQSLIMTAALAVLCVGGAVVALRYAGYWLPPVVAVLGVMFAYPLWSWRKLEATQRYFDEELVRLEREPSVVPVEASHAIAPRLATREFVPDVIEKRIGALKLATQRMRSLNRFISDSLESLPEAAIVSDMNGRVMLANSSADKLFGAAPDAAKEEAGIALLEGRDLFELMSNLQQNDTATWRELLAGTYETSKVASVEARATDDREYLVQLAPSFSITGAQTGSIVTLVDISPLRESERKRDEALRFLSHDMRSPQASILTLLELRREDPDSMPVDRLTNRVEKYAKRTLNLADEFLRLAKAERSRPQDFAPIELTELQRDVAEEGWSLASNKKIKVAVDGPDGEAWVNGDRDLLTRVVMNLLSNAIKYSPPETAITVRLRAVAQNWVLEVADQGYGIAEADMSKLFNRFQRIHREGQPEEDGIGLGLVFVKTVVARHGGTVGVTSKAKPRDGEPGAESRDHGTTFSVTLPAIASPHGAADT